MFGIFFCELVKNQEKKAKKNSKKAKKKKKKVKKKFKKSLFFSLKRKEKKVQIPKKNLHNVNLKYYNL